MQIRPATSSDADRVGDIDATIESREYLHVERAGEGLQAAWSVQVRPRREKLIAPNRMDDDTLFVLKQIVSGFDEGWAMVCEIEDDRPAAIAIARPLPRFRTVQLLDLRVDFDYRRQGLGTALAYQVLSAARDAEHRAVFAETRTDNLPANRFLEKLGFTLAGVDTMRHSNHDLVKESATLLWYLELAE
jgi:ribosomal protein S18 acetylase RimI-like enzyme